MPVGGRSGRPNRANERLWNHLWNGDFIDRLSLHAISGGWMSCIAVARISFSCGSRIGWNRQGGSEIFERFLQFRIMANGRRISILVRSVAEA